VPRTGHIIIAGVSFTVLQTTLTTPVLAITKTHSGNFTSGQRGATYTITVSNQSGAVSTSGTITVTDILPSGLTLVSMLGSGWTCSSNTCSRSDVLVGDASYPPITVTVNVAANANSPQVNAASVSGGGSAAANTNDSTMIGSPATLSVSKTKLNFGVAGSTISDAQTIAVLFTGGAAASWTASSNQPTITVSPASGVGNGTFQVTALPGAGGIVSVTAPGMINSPQQIQVSITTVPAAPPYGSFDTPLDNTTGIAGAIPVTGWTLDNIETTGVIIYREPIGNEPTQPNGLVFIGNATFVAGARPDVEMKYPNAPLNYRAGWGYMLLTNFLPNGGGSPGPGNGTYKLHAIATDKAGMMAELGTRTITVDNAHASKPFGTIDTPDQGGNASGNAFVNFGWALTQNPYMIPTNGSTLNVYIDGLPQGHPTYNQVRSDIATLFPGFANSNGAVGFFFIDTTRFANGVHNIAWSVCDNANRCDGIGSRYFNVLNTGTASVATPQEPTQASPGRTVILRHGFDLTRQAQAMSADRGDTHVIEIEELERIELQVGAPSGYLSMNGERRPLPIGSTLKDGMFHWQPGPGFLGEYDLFFERPEAAPVSLRIVIHPKR
jgi:uncharacterized repeat protein (TIGR01451 family)